MPLSPPPKILAFTPFGFCWSWRERQKLKHKLPLGVYGSLASSHADPELDCTEPPRNSQLAQKESEAQKERSTPVHLSPGECAEHDRVGPSSEEHAVPAGRRDPLWPGGGRRWGDRRHGSSLCLRLSNEALLIQIRVNDYLIIPVLQRAPLSLRTLLSKFTAH